MSPIIKKIVDVKNALEKIPDNATVAVSGFNMATTPDYLLRKLYELYESTGHPQNLFIESDTFPGAPGRGIDFIAEKIYKDPDQKFIRGVLMPFLGWSQWLQKLVLENRIEAYSWSIGIASYWFREIAAGRPGLLTRVGLHTFLDPRIDEACLNELARKRRTCKVHLIKIDGNEYLFYQAPKPQVALIRGTTSDEIGNITMEKEGIFGTVLGITQATKAQPNPGIVIAQVERISRFGSLHPQLVRVPGPLVDYVVISPPEYHWQSGSIEFDPRISGTIIPSFAPELIPRMELSVEKVIARRIVIELVELIKKLRRPLIINLGIGIPAYVTNIAFEEDILDFIYTTVEAGPWGGIALKGIDFGVSIGPFAIIPMPDQFSLYEGGIIDAAALGFLEIDSEGNVNPSMLPDRMPGPGGFPVIAAGSPRIFFGGEFTAGKRTIRVTDGKLIIQNDGSINKFVKRVYKIVFNGKTAIDVNKEVLYITERAVFRLSKNGLVLEEIAPGVDLEKHILSKMEFCPIINPKLKEMDKRLFQEEPMGLKEELEMLFK